MLGGIQATMQQINIGSIENSMVLSQNFKSSKKTDVLYVSLQLLFDSSLE